MSTREEELRGVIYDLTQQVQDRDAEIERLRALLREASDALQIMQADVQLTSNAYEAQRQAIAAIRAELGGE